MTDSPQGRQYPQMPSDPQGSVAPGPVPPPVPPTAIKQAVTLMRGGAAVGFIVAIATSLATHDVAFSYSSTSSGTTADSLVGGIISGIISGIITAALWLWMAWKTGDGRGWARVLSSIFFGIACLALLGSIAPSDRSFIVIILTLVEWGVGLAATVYLWNRESSEFFASAKQSRLARAYGYRPPQYGQPGYGQRPPSDQ
jgi:hypothetical protein